VSSLVIQARRGDAIESLHRVSVAVVTEGGELVARSGDPTFPTFLRSAAKPFQAMPLVSDGIADRFGVTDEELALACASHNSERRQVGLVRGLLARIGCDESHLACGPHRPLAFDLAVRPDGAAPPTDLAPPGPLASNCSGKHAGMLALARGKGWAIEGYTRPDHPVQQRCRAEVAAWTGVEEAALAEGVDGCGVVTFQVPLVAAARAFARFGASDRPAVARLRMAMTGHPDLVAGRDRLDTELMRAYPGAIVTKVGADGVWGAALLRRGLGLAVKVEDGHVRASMVALLAVLDQLGLDPHPSEILPRFASQTIVNTRGLSVGSLRPAGGLTFE